MKYTIIVLLLVMNPLWALAKKNNTFADVGLCTGSGLPGISVTYNRKLLKYVGIGVGGQGYYYSVPYGNTNINQHTPAVYGDLRGYVPIKRSFLFMMLDMGVDFYKGHNALNTLDSHTNGMYTGFGIGYCSHFGKWGIQPYMSVKIVSDSYKSTQYSTITNESHEAINVDATAVLSAGFRF